VKCPNRHRGILAAGLREILPIETGYREIHYELARWEGKMVSLSPEYEDCKRLATKKGVPLKDVFEEARRVAMISTERAKPQSTKHP